jgi:hypothetical protein
VRALLPHLWITLELLQKISDLAATALTLSMRLDLPLLANNKAYISKRKPLRDVLMQSV